MNRQRWAQVEAERIALANRIAPLPPEGWDHPSRCQGWRVRDVLGHLVDLAETPLWRRALRRGGPDPARQLGARPVPELCQRLRDAAASRYTHMPAVALSEVVVHGDDMLGPLGQPIAVSPAVAVAVLRQLRRVDRLAARGAFGGRPHRGVRLSATDAGWESGTGPEVTGTATGLMALLANRAGAVGKLAGPGVCRLPEYRAEARADPAG